MYAGGGGDEGGGAESDAAVQRLRVRLASAWQAAGDGQGQPGSGRPLLVPQ